MRKKRRRLTLIEIVIVMSLIAMVMGVLAYNYQGSLDEGKVFKSEQAISKITSILTLALAEDPELGSSLSENWYQIVLRSPLINDPKQLARDGWGDEFNVTYEEGRVEVHSRKLDEYKAKRRSR
ncbi:MAG: putative outer membrane protein [Chlamydiales bacterium]|jgi:hypothetical protein|nr:putative outer membrane protein [Chlamydiales bacterium]